MRLGAGKRMKHLETQSFFIQDLTAKGIVRIEKVHKDSNIADIGTKYITKETLHRLVKLLCSVWMTSKGQIVNAEGTTTGGATGVSVDLVNYYYYDAGVKDWILLVVLVIIITQVILKILENTVLDAVVKGVKVGYRLMMNNCKRRKNEEEILKIQIRTAQGSSVCHYYECEHVRRMNVEKKKEWTTCTVCKRWYENNWETKLQEARDENV